MSITIPEYITNKEEAQELIDLLNKAFDKKNTIRFKTFISLITVDDCLKYIAGKHMKPNQYYNFSEKGKNHWLVNANGKTIIMWPNDSGNNIASATDNTLIDNNYFKITRYGYNPWRDSDTALFYTRRYGNGGYDNGTYVGMRNSSTPLYQDNYSEMIGYLVSSNGTNNYTVTATKRKNDASSSYNTGGGLSFFLPSLKYIEK